jgi:hypothetical protein
LKKISQHIFRIKKISNNLRIYFTFIFFVEFFFLIDENLALNTWIKHSLFWFFLCGEFSQLGNSFWEKNGKKMKIQGNFQKI